MNSRGFAIWILVFRKSQGPNPHVFTRGGALEFYVSKVLGA